MGINVRLNNDGISHGTTMLSVTPCGVWDDVTGRSTNNRKKKFGSCSILKKIFKKNWVHNACANTTTVVSFNHTTSPS